MATVTPTLTISSTDALVDTLALSVTTNLTISGNSAFGKSKCTTTEKEIYGTSYGRSMIYAKNLGTTAGELVELGFGTGNDDIALDAGEFAIFPWDGTSALYAVSSSGTPTLEHAIFEF